MCFRSIWKRKGHEMFYKGSKTIMSQIYWKIVNLSILSKISFAMIIICHSLITYKYWSYLEYLTPVR